MTNKDIAKELVKMAKSIDAGAYSNEKAIKFLSDSSNVLSKMYRGITGVVGIDRKDSGLLQDVQKLIVNTMSGIDELERNRK